MHLSRIVRLQLLSRRFHHLLPYCESVDRKLLNALHDRKPVGKRKRSRMHILSPLEVFSLAAGVEGLEGIDKEALRRWREQWASAHSTHRKRLSQLKAFFAVAKAEGWIDQSPQCRPRSPSPASRYARSTLLMRA